MLAPSPPSTLPVEMGAAVGLHVNPAKMDAVEKSQTLSITKLPAQLCKAHGLPVCIKLWVGVESGLYFLLF